MCEIEIKVLNKLKKLLEHWSSNHFTNYKSDVITGELHRAKKMVTDFNYDCSS